MIEIPNGTPRVIGLKQSRKAVRDGVALCAYVALDAEERVRLPFIELCAEFGVPVVDFPAMKVLGEAVEIDIGSAVVVTLK